MIALADPRKHRWEHSALVLVAAAVTAYYVAFLLAEVLMVGFGVSPHFLGGAADFAPGSDALSEALKGALGPAPHPTKVPEATNPAVAEAIQKLTREILWIQSPWRIALNNAMVALVAWILIPWLGVAASSRPALMKTERDRRRFLCGCLGLAPTFLLCALVFRGGLWVAALSFSQGPSVTSLLPHLIPELAACLACALIPVHFYLRYVRAESPIRYSSYSLRQGGTYALASALLVVAAFIEVGRLRL